MNETALAFDHLSSLSDIPGEGNHVINARTSDALSAIHHPGKNIALFDREIAEGLVKFVESLKETELPNQHFMIAVPHVRAAISHGIAAHWPESSLGRQLFCHDLSNLAELYVRLTNARRIKVSIRSDFVEDHHYFQSESGKLRLLTIYKGNGVEWVPDIYVDRQAVADGEKGDFSVCEDLSKVCQLPRFTLALFKGEAAPNGREQGAVYKITPKNEGRLIVSIEES